MLPVTCTDPTPHFDSGCELLLYYDTDNDGKIDYNELINDAYVDYKNGTITKKEVEFVIQAYNLGDGGINKLCKGCYGELTPIFAVSNFTVTPSSCKEPCDVVISITWINVGSGTGTKTLYYTVNGTKHLLGTETLAPNASVTYAATETGLSAGSYTICPDPNE